MPDNYNKPSYNRKQELYVKSSSKQQQKKRTQPTNKNNKNKKNNKSISNSQSNQSKGTQPNVNQYKGSQYKGSQPKSNRFKFIVTLLITLVVFSSIFVYAGYRITNNSANKDTGSNGSNSTGVDSTAIDKENVNVLLIGLDEVSKHTDTMVVANLNTKDGSVELISIPRDTYITLPQETVDMVRSKQTNPIMPRSGNMKLTELVPYTQDVDLGLELLKDYIGSMLGVEIDSYVAVSLDSFKYLIDEMGGVYFDVPQRMYYNDNAQDLHIDLQPGYQLIDGDKAEQLIRFRKKNKGDTTSGTKSYVQGDLDRIQVQQDFLKAVINQVLSKGNLMGNLVSLAKTYYNYVETDIGIISIPKYAQYALTADKDNISTYSLPVEDTNVDGKSHIIPNDTDIKTLSDKVFYGIQPVEETVETTDNTSTDTNGTTDSTSTNNSSTTTLKPKSSYSITILNGSGISGFAGKTSELLKADGFTVTDIGDYTQEKQEVTRLFVNDRNNADAVKNYFDLVEVVYLPNQQEDIIIVLGTKETLKGKL